MAETRAAIGLLTRLPVAGTRAADSDASGAVAFPLVGGLSGAIGALPLVLAGALEPVLGSLLAIGLLAILTGALHLDGLADTADALLARDAERAERARKDPAVGPGGAIALILVLGLETAALAAIVASSGGRFAAAALIVAAAVSRALPVVAIVTRRGALATDGFGAWFAARVRPSAAVIAIVLAAAITGAIAVVAGSAVLAVGGLVGAAIGLLATVAIVAGRGRLDGDGMGAIVELTLAATLTFVALAT